MDGDFAKTAAAVRDRVCKADLTQLDQSLGSSSNYWYVVSHGGGNGGGSGISWSGFGAGDVVTIAVDVDAGSVTFSKNDETGVSCSNLVGPVCLMVNTNYASDGCTILGSRMATMARVKAARARLAADEAAAIFHQLDCNDDGEIDEMELRAGVRSGIHASALSLSTLVQS